MLALVTSIKPYEFTDEKTQRVISGFSLIFYDAVSEIPVDRGKGCDYIKISGSKDILGQFPNPGLYDLDVAPVMKAGKPSWELRGGSCKRNVNVRQICESLLK